MKTINIFFSALLLCANFIIYPSFYDYYSFSDIQQEIDKKVKERTILERKLVLKHSNLKERAKLETEIDQLSQEINDLYDKQSNDTYYHHSYPDYYSSNDSHYHHSYPNYYSGLDTYYDHHYPDYYSSNDSDYDHSYPNYYSAQHSYYDHRYLDYYSSNDSDYDHSYPNYYSAQHSYYDHRYLDYYSSNDSDYDHSYPNYYSAQHSYYDHGYPDFYSHDSDFYTVKRSKTKKDLHNELYKFSPYKNKKKEHTDFKKDIQKLINGLKNNFISVPKWNDIINQAKKLGLSDKFITDLENLSRNEKKEFHRIINKIITL